MRRVNVHPWWCARGRVCGAHRRDGEHRSHPVRIDVAGCRLLATRIQTADPDRAEGSTVTAVREALTDTTWGGGP